MRTDVLVVGGGLSGLHTAYALKKRGVRCLVAEARDRLGGRILSRHWPNVGYDAAQPAFDLGPAWFWPGQARMRSLVAELGLADQVFEQASRGDSIYENAQGDVKRGDLGISMAGSYRLNGGMRHIVSNLAGRISVETIIQSAAVTRVTRNAHDIASTLNIDGRTQEIISNIVVFALPPRLAIASIEFNPPLSPSRQRELSALATWMAGHAKLITFYEQPFWRTQGLSGDAISHLGPLHEIHDASPDTGGPYALFGFVAVPASLRRMREADIKAAAVKQLARLFGEAASMPLGSEMKDWAADAFTATETDQTMMTHHPTSALHKMTEPAWNNRIIWSGTETAGLQDHNYGYLEGALASSIRTLGYLASRPVVPGRL